MNIEMMNLDEIPLMSFINGCTEEMKALSADHKCVIGNSLAQQQLPRHMRRRAASHKANRLPIRLREQYLFEQQKNEDAKKLGKKSSRKFRRKSKNIFANFAHRQLNGLWLETHVWHAKRFHMAKKWGWKMPMRRCDRGDRAAYRDAKNQCLIQDISYNNCFEITGDENIIINNLNQLIDPNSGSSPDARMYIEGLKEGDIFLYKRNSFPFGAIGPATYLWQLRTNHASKSRLMWLFVHPACSCEVQAELNNLIWTNGTTFKLLSKEFCRFRLIGPKALAVLFDSLVDYKSECETNLLDGDINENVTGHMTLNFEEKVSVAEYTKNRVGLWRICDKKLAPDSVIGGLVCDPRIHLPEKIIPTWNLPQPDLDDEWVEVSSELASTLIWNKDVRSVSCKLKASNHQLNQLRQRFLSIKSLSSAYNPFIPVIIIGKCCRSSQSSNLAYQQWHLITPSSWGMPFWISLIYRGGHSIGVGEFNTLCRESRLMSFPFDYPDMASGQMAEEERAFATYKKFMRRPPAKRCNINIAATALFGCPWPQLFNDSTPAKPFYCLRDSGQLRRLQQRLLDDGFSTSGKVISVKRLRVADGGKLVRKKMKENTVVNGKQIKCQIQTMTLINDLNLTDERCLVPVVIKCQRRGVPKDCALIYVPLDTDNIESTNNVRGDDLFYKPTKNSKRRKIKSKVKDFNKKAYFDENTKILHLKNIASSEIVMSNNDVGNGAENKKSNAGNNNSINVTICSNNVNGVYNDQASTINNIYNIDCSKINTEHNMNANVVSGSNALKSKCMTSDEKLRLNWQRNKEANLISNNDSSLRKLIGFVTAGGFSFAEGKGLGLGYVTIEGIKEIIELNKKIRNSSSSGIKINANILFRNATSNIYHNALLNVCI